MTSSSSSFTSQTQEEAGKYIEVVHVLPSDYEPCPHTVIIGRGKRVYNHVGNRRYQVLLQQHREAYTASTTRAQKTEIICGIIKAVRKSSVKHVGFVKQDPSGSSWIALQDIAARSAVGQAFRDLLKDRYRSSKKSKQVQRLLDKKQHGHQGQSLVSSLGASQHPKNMPRAISFNKEDVRASNFDVAGFAAQQQFNDNNSKNTSWLDKLCVLLGDDDVHHDSNPFEPKPLPEQQQHQSSMIGMDIITSMPPPCDDTS